jgi:hypothetical protein
MKEIITAPTMKIRKSTKIMKCEKTIENPGVSRFSPIDEIPKPILSLKSRRKRVDATHIVRLMTAKLV